MTAPIRVLHIDDDSEFADLTATFLGRQSEEMIVETVTNAAAGLERLEEAAFDCVVSDYDMPEMDGIELLETVREAHPDLPFILFTGKGGEEVASDAISAGVTDYLQKKPGTDQYTLLENRIRNAVERARAEQASQRHLTAVETAREGMSILNSDGEFVYVNQAYADLYGYEPDEMVGEHWRLIYPDDQAEFVDTELLPTVDEEGYWHGETTGLRADGSTFPEDHVVSRTAHGDLVCTVRDRSDKRERMAELRLKTRAMDEAPIGITISGPAAEDNPLVYVNESFETLTGYQGAEILGQNCRFLQGADTREEPIDAMREAIENVEPATVELRNYRKDGTEFWNRVTIAPLIDDDGTVHNWVGFQEDITQRKEQERKRAVLEHGIEQIGTGIATYGEAGQIRYANEQYAELLGTTRSELLGTPIWEINPEFDCDRFEDYWNSYEPGETRVHESVHERFDTGERIPTRTTTTQVEIHGTPYHIGTITDISEQKSHERQLQREIDRLDDFASIVSHDLRNPLNVAQGHLGLLAEECDSAHTETVDDALDRMNEIITDTLTLARQGKIVDETEPISLGDVVNQCWRNAETGDAVLDLTEDLTIHADPERLRSLLENLFRNAADHAGDVTVRVGAIGGRGFYVADDGPGIPSDEREDVFEAGYSTAEGSSGFGLAIVKEIAEAHGWDVVVTDGPQGGARFEFTGVDVGE